MAVLGWIFLVLLALTVVGGLMLVIISLPDIRRYLAIKRM
jgi:hypothetical protein